MSAQIAELPNVDCRETMASSDSWLNALQVGEPTGWAELIRNCSGRMLAVARRMLPCEHDAADAVQEAFIAAFRSIDRLTHGGGVGAWLHRITVNTCLMELRSSRRRPALSRRARSLDESGEFCSVFAADAPSAPERLEADELAAALRGAIEALPTRYRQVFLLRDIEGFDTQQTAGILGISRAAVKVQLHRARQALQTHLTGAY